MKFCGNSRRNKPQSGLFSRHYLHDVKSPRLRFFLSAAWALIMLLLVIYQFVQDNFFRTVTDAVRATYPFHLVSRFECFGHALLLRHSGNDDFHTLVAGLVDFGQVLEQCTLHHIVGVKDFTVFFQIVTAQTSVFADLIIAVIRQNKVRDEIIAHLTIYAALQNRQLSEGDRIQMQFENSSSLVQL